MTELCAACGAPLPSEQDLRDFESGSEESERQTASQAVPEGPRTESESTPAVQEARTTMAKYTKTAGTITVEFSELSLEDVYDEDAAVNHIGGLVRSVLCGEWQEAVDDIAVDIGSFEPEATAYEQEVSVTVRFSGMTPSMEDFASAVSRALPQAGEVGSFSVGSPDVEEAYVEVTDMDFGDIEETTE